MNRHLYPKQLTAVAPLDAEGYKLFFFKLKQRIFYDLILVHHLYEVPEVLKFEMQFETL